MIKKIIRFINFIILIILLASLLYVCYEKYIEKNSFVKLGGYGILVVLTNSMEPTIQEKELVVIKESENYDLEDIVTYVDVYGNLVTHRIVQIDEYTFMAKGDRNEITDNNMDIRNIEGKVVFHSKVLGIFVLYYLKIVILIYFGVLLVGYLINQFKEEKKVDTSEPSERDVIKNEKKENENSNCG